MIRVSSAYHGAQSAYVVSGPEVDHHLQEYGALAQAFSPELILISSAVSELPQHQRDLLYLHEFAHIRQWANGRGGKSDPVAELEAEAWQAAYCWSQGVPFTIQGRTATALNALALIQGGPAGHPSAPAWYRSNPIEPISQKDTITVDDVTILDPITLDTVLDAIIATKATEIVVVCHGTSQGLAMGTHDGSSAFADRNVLTALAADHRGEDKGMDGTVIVTPIKSDDDVRFLMKTNLAQVEVLRKKMNAVRARKLKHIAFRACNMGSSDETMKAFLRFFGCDSISAPTIEDMYGIFPTEVTKDLTKWVKDFRGARFHVFSDGKVAFATKWASGIHYKLKCGGISNGDILDWVKKHIVSGAVDPSSVVFHGMKVDDGPTLKENEPNVYFVRDPDFISRITFATP